MLLEIPVFSSLRCCMALGQITRLTNTPSMASNTLIYALSLLSLASGVTASSPSSALGATSQPTSVRSARDNQKTANSPSYSAGILPHLHYLPPEASGFSPAAPSGPLASAGNVMAHYGIYLRALAVDEFARNVTGGQSTGWGNSFASPFGTDIDLERLVGLKGGSFHMTINKSIGSSLASDYTGNKVSFQTRFKPYHEFRLGALAYTQKILDDRVSFTSGRISALTFFDESTIYCNFQNNAFCFKPLSLALQNGAWNFFPYSSWGGHVKVSPSKQFYISGGIFEYNPALYPTNGFDFSTSQASGISWGAEIGTQSASPLAAHAYHLKLGAFGNTASIADPEMNTHGQSIVQFGGTAQRHNGQQGFYVQGDLVTWRFGSKKKRNMTLFGGVAISPGNYLKFKNQSTIGMVITGLFNTRNQDTLGLAATYYQLGSHEISFLQARRQKAGGGGDVYSDEGIVELNYNALITRGVHLMPSFQYVISPDNMLTPKAKTSSKNIAVFGLRLTVEVGAVLGLPIYSSH